MNTPAADSPPISLPHDKEVALRVIPMPADANANGDIFGGWIMSQVDLAGSIPAVRRARGRIATVAVNQFVFKQPVQIGDVVSFYATIKRVGRTSVTVDVEVFSERKRGTFVVKVTEAELTYVAITMDGKPRELQPEGDTVLV
jgi:acyl-CoA thioesterase YciA